MVDGFGHVADGFTAVNRWFDSRYVSSLDAAHFVLGFFLSCGIVFLKLYLRVCSVHLVFPGASQAYLLQLVGRIYIIIQIV